MSGNPVERRGARRVPLVARVEAASTGVAFLAATANVSAAGMLIHTANPLPAGAEVVLRFALAEGAPPVEVRAVVRRVVEGAAMGVEFLGLPDGARAALERLAAQSP